MRRRTAAAGLGLIVVLGAFSGGLAQAPSTSGASAPDVYSNTVRYNRGQSIQPVFEGWSRNPDGSFAMWFGTSIATTKRS